MHQPAQGENHTLARLSESESEQLLAEAKSELLKQECRADCGETHIRELQRQIESQRMESNYTISGNEALRREQARLHEELAQRDRALREAHIRSLHDVQEMKRVQEMRTDEFSRQQLRGSQNTINELTSQIQELQDQVDFMNDPREFREVESVCSGIFSHVSRIRLQWLQVLVVCLAATKARDPRRSGVRLVHRETFFANPLAYIDSAPGLAWNPKVTGGDSMQTSTGDL